MFEKSGEKLIGMAKLNFCLGVVAAVAWGLNFWKYAKLISILIIAGGSLAFYIISLLICTFGEIAENTRKTEAQLSSGIASNRMQDIIKENQAIVKGLQQLREEIKRDAAGSSQQAQEARNATGKTVSADTAPDSLDDESFKVIDPTQPITPIPEEADKEYCTCPICGQRQRSGRSICFKCGQRFSETP